jgi:lysozyme family protein
MANFDEAFAKTIRVEGGYNANPNDKGNYTSKGNFAGTMWGIAAKTYEDAYGHEPTVENMRALTKSQAREIYKKIYWNPLKADFLTNQSVAEIMFDYAFNRHPDKAASMAAAVLTFLGKPINTNRVTTEMLNLINSADQQQFFNTFKLARIAWYKKHAQKIFLANLIERTNSFTFNS